MAVRPETDDLIRFLNDLLAVDREFVTALLNHRPTCNEALADHPSVQVSADSGVYRTGVLGVLNGYAGTVETGEKAGWGPITAMFEGDVLLRFERTPEA